jgi:hypothetical protein
MRRVPLPTVVPVRPIALTSLVVLLAWPAGAWSGDQGPYRVLAGPYSKRDVKAGVGRPAARAIVGGLTITVEFLEPAARAAFVKSIAPATPDPFAARPGRPETFSAFRVAFDNRSAADVQFQAGNVVLITDRKTQDFPVDLTDLYRVAEEVGAADPERAIDRIAPIIFDSSTTIPKGKNAERLLVFGPFPAKWKEFQLHFSFLQIGTQTHTVSFSFHKQPLKG